MHQATLLALCLFIVFSTGHVYASTIDSYLYEKPVEKCLTIEVYSDISCPHCTEAYEFLYELQKKHPDIEIVTKDLIFKRNRDEFIRLSKYHEVEKPATPSFLICEKFLVGFDDPEHYGVLIKYLMGLTDTIPFDLTGDTVNIPVLGNVSANQLGLPIFTVIIGLIDGFNPCAMWVLLFLLSLLLNLRERKKIVAIAGTFVFVSGFVYFAFMAAWLNIFLAIGFSRHAQVLVGIVAVSIGLIHIKDFYSLNKGISLSIPDSVKPGLYARIRRVIYAENMLAAILGVALIALLVNMVELICTAGLPAIYTQILTLRELSLPEYYGYLLIYNLAYIFDDVLMVSIVVYTLSKKKLQEAQGRWLKLLSGLIIMVLGVLLLIKPSWLF